MISAGIASEWCSWTHGGGKIERDPSGRVNWQCSKCGRWAEPVNESDEANLLKRHLEGARDCAGGMPCTTCPDKRHCERGCVRIPDFIKGTP